MYDFYENLHTYKVRNKLTNTNLGKLVNKKGDTFRATVAAKSLSILEIEKLTSIINQEDNKPLEEIIIQLIKKEIDDRLKPIEDNMSVSLKIVYRKPNPNNNLDQENVSN